MVMLGAFVRISGLFTEEQFSRLLVKLLAGRNKQTMIDINRRAIRLGMDKVLRLR
jgi:Pyruvate/2-oxoacid:ferredoxin oxidoreductase gamma subunit